MKDWEDFKRGYFQPVEIEECETCGGLDGEHLCECGATISEKRCKEGRLCGFCEWLLDK